MSNLFCFKGRPGTDGFYGSHGSSVSYYKIIHAVYFICLFQIVVYYFFYFNCSYQGDPGPGGIPGLRGPPGVQVSKHLLL